MIDSEDKKLMEKFKAVTGKNAIWQGKITKGYLTWKEKQGRQIKEQISTTQKKNDSVIFDVQSNIQKIFTKLENFEYRLKTLEKKSPEYENVEKLGEISDDHFFRILKSAYN